MPLAKGKLLAQSSVCSQDWMGLGRWGVLTQTPWEVLLRPLFWPRVLVWLASWSVTPAPRQVPRALRMLVPQGWLPSNHSCLSPCPWVRGVRSVSLTHPGNTKSRMCTPKGLKKLGCLPKGVQSNTQTPATPQRIHACRETHPGTLHNSDALDSADAHLCVHGMDTNCSHHEVGRSLGLDVESSLGCQVTTASCTTRQTALRP